MLSLNFSFFWRTRIAQLFHTILQRCQIPNSKDKFALTHLRHVAAYALCHLSQSYNKLTRCERVSFIIPFLKRHLPQFLFNRELNFSLWIVSLNAYYVKVVEKYELCWRHMEIKLHSLCESSLVCEIGYL